MCLRERPEWNTKCIFHKNGSKKIWCGHNIFFFIANHFSNQIFNFQPYPSPISMNKDQIYSEFTSLFRNTMIFFLSLSTSATKGGWMVSLKTCSFIQPLATTFSYVRIQADRSKMITFIRIGSMPSKVWKWWVLLISRLDSQSLWNFIKIKENRFKNNGYSSSFYEMKAKLKPSKYHWLVPRREGIAGQYVGVSVMQAG